MAKYVGYKRPKDTKKTMKHFLTYLGHYKWAFFLVAILVFSACSLTKKHR